MSGWGFGRRMAMGALLAGACATDVGDLPEGITIDQDGDSVPANADCDDTDPKSTVRSRDGDCDGVLERDDCDDADPGVGRCDDTASDSGDSGDSGTTVDTGTSGDSGTTVDSGDSGDSGVPPTNPGDGMSSPRLGTVRYVPSGTFTMGCVTGRDDVAGGCQSDESPLRAVILTTAMWMMESELTQGMWTGLGYANPSSFSGSSKPAETVNWWEALEAANEASRRDGLSECYALTGCGSNAVGTNRECTGVSMTSPSGHPKDCAGWRLPTEAEWEYAARAGTSGPYSGSADVDQVAWYDGNNGAFGTSTYGTKSVCTTPTPRNAWGLCDLSGNVYEWTHDWHDTYPSGSATDPTGPASGSGRGYRGGRWDNVARGVRVAFRSGDTPGDRSYYLGFRLVRSVP